MVQLEPSPIWKARRSAVCPHSMCRSGITATGQALGRCLLKSSPLLIQDRGRLCPAFAIRAAATTSGSRSRFRPVCTLVPYACGSKGCEAAVTLVTWPLTLSPLLLLAQLALTALAGWHHALPAPLAWCRSYAPLPAKRLAAAGNAVLQGQPWMEVEQPVCLAARTSLLLQGSARRARRNLSLMPAPQFAHARLTFMASTVKLLARLVQRDHSLLLALPCAHAKLTSLAYQATHLAHRAHRGLMPRQANRAPRTAIREVVSATSIDSTL